MPSSNGDAQLRAVVAIARTAVADEPAARVPSSTHPTPYRDTHSRLSLIEELVEGGERGAQRGAYHGPRLLIVPTRADVPCVGGALRGACWGYPVRAMTQAPRGTSYPAVGVRA